MVVLNPGGNWPPKRWSEDKFAELGDLLRERYGARVVLTGAEKDIDTAKRIEEQADIYAFLFKTLGMNEQE